MAVAELLVKVGADITALQRGLNQASSAVQGFSGKLQSAGGAISGVGKKMTMGLTLPIVGLGVAMAKVAGDFEQQINILGVAAKGGGASLEDLRQSAIAVGADTKLVGISASEAAGAITEMYKAGLSTSQIFGDMQGYLKGTAELGGALKASIDLAAASELDLASATDTVTVAMATFGIEESKAAQVADTLVKAADASVASVGGLADALKNVGPTAAAFGWELGEVSTALAVLSTRGIEGAEAGTALKSMMLNMTRQTPKVTSALQELGVALYDTSGAMRSLPDIVGDMDKAMAGMTDQQKQYYVATIAGSYGQKAMNTLLEEGAAGWSEMEGAMAGAAGVQESAAARTKGFAAAMEQLHGAIETFMIVAGTPLIENVLMPLVQVLTKVIGAFAEAPPGVIKLALAIAGIVAVVGPVLIVIGQIITAIGTIGSVVGGAISIVTGLGGAIAAAFAAVAAASAPVLIAIAAIALAIGALYLAWKNNWLGIRDTMDMVVSAIKATFERIKQMFKSVGQWLSGEITFDKMVESIKFQMGRIASIWSLVWDKLTAKIREVGSVIATAASSLKDKVLGFIEGLKSGFLGKLAEMVSKAAGIVAGLVGKIWGALTGGGGDGGGGGFELDLSAIGALKDVIVGAMNVIKAAITEMTIFTANTLIAWLQLVQSNITMTWTAIRVETTAFLTALQTSIIESLTTLYQFITGWLAQLHATWANYMQQILSSTMTTWLQLVTFVIEQTNVMRTTVVAIVMAMAAQIKAILQDLADAGRKAGEALAQGVADGIRSKQGAAVAAALALAAAVRAALPSSDAKVGPLSDLTASGKALPETLAKGIRMSSSTLNRALYDALGNAPSPTTGIGGTNQIAPSNSSQNITINVNNPNGETTNASVSRHLRNLAYLGMLNTAGANA